MMPLGGEETHQEYPGICLEYVWHIYGIFMVSEWNIYGI